jgi:hypothetical protein
MITVLGKKIHNQEMLLDWLIDIEPKLPAFATVNNLIDIIEKEVYKDALREKQHDIQSTHSD